MEIVYLPHSVRIEPANCSDGLNYLGVTWYRRHFYVDAPFLFEAVTWEPGILLAEALIEGKVAATHTVKTPDAADYLTLTADDCGIALIADGSDLVMVHAFVRDASGTIISNAYNKISFRLTGPAEIIGDGDSRVGSNPIEAEAGAIGIVIRATEEPGMITLHAESEGLKSASVEFISKACMYRGRYKPRLPQNRYMLQIWRIYFHRRLQDTGQSGAILQSINRRKRARSFLAAAPIMLRATA